MQLNARRVDKPLVLYGYGKLGHLAEEIFKELEIPILHILDQRQKCDIKIPNGESKTSYFARLPRESLLVICVATEPYNQIIAPLKAAGWTDIMPVWDIIEAYPEVGIHNGFIFDPTDEDTHKTYEVMGNLADELSQRHYGAFMDWHISHFEHSDIIITPGPSLPSTLADIRRRQKVIHWGDSHHTFWNSYGDSGTAYIHQEGKELETLMANMEVFQNYRPKISCACYHSRDSLWRIQKTLMDNLPDYQWTFRLHAYMGQGAYIYGTPKEREDG